MTSHLGIVTLDTHRPCFVQHSIILVQNIYFVTSSTCQVLPSTFSVDMPLPKMLITHFIFCVFHLFMAPPVNLAACGGTNCAQPSTKRQSLSFRWLAEIRWSFISPLRLISTILWGTMLLAYKQYREREQFQRGHLIERRITQMATKVVQFIVCLWNSFFAATST